MNYNIQEILANPTLLNKVPDEILLNWIKEYPYVSLFHLYALKNKGTYSENELHKTAFHFHNREKLYFLLNTKDSAIIQEAKIGGIIPVIEEEFLHQKSESVENKILLEEVNEVKQPIVEEVISKEITQPIIEETNEIDSKISEETIPEIVEETVIEKPIVEEKLSAAEIVLQRIQQIKLERENPKSETENKSESVENKILLEEAIEVKQPIVEEVVSEEIIEPIIDETKEIDSKISEETIPEIVEETVIEKPIVEEKLSAAEIVLQRIQQIKLERENPKTENENKSESVENKILLEEVIEVKQPIVEEVVSEEITQPIIEETKEIDSKISEETIPEIVEETVVEKPIVEEKLSAAEIVLQRIQQIKLERENPKTENENESESVENKILSVEVNEVKQPIVEEVVSKEIADPIIEETKEIVSEISEETIPEIVEETVVEKPIVEEKLSAAEIVLQRIQQIKLERENPKTENKNKSESENESESESVENKILLEEPISRKQPNVEEVVSKEITQPIIEETKEIVSEISEETIPEIVEEKPIVEEIEEKINEKITTTEILAVEKTEETSNVIQEKTDLQKSLVVQIIPEFTNIHDEIENNFVTISIEKEITPKTEYKDKEKEIEVENSTTQIQTTDANIETAVEFKDEIKHEISEAVVEKPIIENKIIEEIIEPIIEQKTEQLKIIEKTVEPNIQNTSEPHTFVEWLKLLDGKLQIQTAPNNQTDNWMEIPRYEVEQSLQNKKTEKSLDELAAEIKQSNQKEEKITIQPVFEEGEIDLFNEIDVEVTKSATESVSFKNDMMTETLANIYVKQGKIEKALDIYNTLRLKFPEKSAYFASLIQNLTKSE